MIVEKNKKTQQKLYIYFQCFQLYPYSAESIFLATDTKLTKNKNKVS